MLKVHLLFLSLFLFLSTTTGVASNVDDMVANHAAITSSDHNAITLQFNLGDVESHQIENESATITQFALEGEGFTLQNNMPELPAVTRMIVVPPTAGLEFVYQASEPTRVQAVHPPRFTNDESQAVMVNLNANIRENAFPAEIAEMSEPFVIRGARLVKVTTYPVQYDAEADEYLIYDNIQAEIRFTDAEPINPSRVPVRRNRSPEFKKFLRSMAINADDVWRDDPDRDAEPEYKGHYLVVAHENCVEYVYDFLEWRRKSGWKVDIFSVPSNMSNNQNQIKAGIQERYDEYLDAGIDPFDQLCIIGDYPAYDPSWNGPAANWRITCDRGNSIWPSNTNHHDWWYACLEDGQGNDTYADVGLSRWIAGSAQTLNLFMHRTMSYETDPYMEETEWFTRGAVYAQKWAGNYDVSLATNVRSGKSVLESVGFDDIRIEENMDQHDGGGGIVGPFIRDQFTDGVNVMIGRAENYFWRHNINGLNANVIYPIDLDIAGHHEWTCWHMLRTNPGTMKGPVAATSGWGGQQTLPYSVVWLEEINGFLQRDMTFGWTYLKSVMGPENYIPRFQQTYPQIRTDIEFYGDPGIQYWQGVPQIVDITFTESILPSDRLVEAVVVDAETGEAVENARVTLYYAGDMPDGDDEDYPEFDEMMMLTKMTGADGSVRFVMSDEWVLESGLPLYLTANGRNIIPNFNEIEILDPDAGVELSGYSFVQIEGNDDDVLNPGEQFGLVLTAHNLDEDNDVADVSVTVTSLSSFVEIGEVAEYSYGDINAGEEATSEGIEIIISPVCPDAASRPVTRPSVQVTFTSGESTWNTAILLNPEAPNMVVSRVVGGNIIEAGMDNINLEIENIGSVASPALHATLVTLGMGVSVVEGEDVYPALDPGDDARLEGDGFRVAGNRIVVPGSTYEMVIILESEAGFIDSAFFDVQVSEVQENSPLGPDNYGYICFDDTDAEWDVAPDYNWLEISLDDRDRDFDGVDLDFSGNSPNSIGETQVVDLPFQTQFYGHMYDQITVASNGFISMGDQEYVTNYQNWPMDRCQGGGAGMIAPLWDDLQIPNDGAIYTFYDEEDSRFIIEWYGLRHRSGGNTDLTFQVVLYDHAVWITETGDQNILIQYKTVANVQGRPGWHTASPFASVGISSPDGNSGINYSFNDVYPVNAAPLANQRAMLFSTSPRYRSGVLFGQVTDHFDGSAVEGAIVSTKHGFTAITDDEGNWRINDALAGVEFDITCIKQGYNDSTQVDLIVEEDEELEINFDILHPEFTPSTFRIERRLDPELETEVGMTIRNTGNGPLCWSVDRRLLGDANASPWEVRRQYSTSETVEDPRLSGVIFANNEFYVTGLNDGEPQIYVLDREGELIRQFDQLNDSHYGMKDLAWDGEWIWGSGEREVIAFNTDGEEMARFEGPEAVNTNVVWDSDLQMLWVSSITQDIIGYDREGNRITSLSRHGLRMYGLAYYRDDPDEHPMYIFHKMNQYGDMVVHKMNTETNDTMLVAVLEPELGGQPGGAYITNTFDVYSWVFMTAVNDGATDRIDVWQVEARKDWFQFDIIRDEQLVEADSGIIQTGEEFEFVLSLNSAELPDTLFQGELFFMHNADSSLGHIYIDLDVIGPEPPEHFSLLEPANDALVESHEVTFNWEISDDPNFDEDVTYNFTVSVNGQSEQVQTMETSVTLNFDELGLDTDWMSSNFASWTVTAVSFEDAVDCNSPFNFMLAAPPSDFELASPDDGSMLESRAPTFTWNPSIDPNPMDSVMYNLWIETGGDSIMVETDESTISVGLDTLGLIYDCAWPVVWWVDALSDEDVVECAQRFTVLFPPTGFPDELDGVPAEFALRSIYPNPFNAIATITFGVDKVEPISLRAFDVTGRQVRILYQGTPEIGWHNVVFNATELPTGVYFMRLEAPGRVKIAKTAMVK